MTKTPRLEFTEKTKQEALILANYKCTKCGKSIDRKSCHFDHKVPNALRRDNSLSNCDPLCYECHILDKTPKDRKIIARAKRLYTKHNEEKKPSKFPIPQPAKTNWPNRKLGNSKKPSLIDKSQLKYGITSND